MKSNDPLPFEAALAGRTVLVTGSTGFTGGWACLWLKTLGARVVGFSLPPPTEPSLFAAAGVADDIEDIRGDVIRYEAVRDAFARTRPDLILHLAAQPLVRLSYAEPLSTFSVNALGTAHVLEAARHTPSVRGVLCITTDKVYQNREWVWPYRENDPLGGKDPYSASKAAAEMIIDSYRVSFPRAEGKGPAIATARGGNIIGGGDWAADRLIPDFVRAVVGGSRVSLRYPDATRPWQHVLALVQGYLQLLAGLASEEPEPFPRAWNLGPCETRQYSVREVLELLAAHWRRPELVYDDAPLPECGALALDSTLAREKLGWHPPWDTRAALEKTAAWYQGFYAEAASARDLTLRQIGEWRAALRAQA